MSGEEQEKRGKGERERDSHLTGGSGGIIVFGGPKRKPNTEDTMKNFCSGERIAKGKGVGYNRQGKERKRTVKTIPRIPPKHGRRKLGLP